MPTPPILNRVATYLLTMLLWTHGAMAADPGPVQARQAWQLLDYIAVDYASAVRDGEIVEPAEFAEMQEFAATVRSRLEALPDVPDRPNLLASATELIASIAARDAPEAVAKIASALADDVLVAYKIEATPNTTPDLAAASTLYAEQCSACHGLRGDGDGPAAAGLNPPPIAFTAASRAAQRSPFALYQVITQGLDGTAMASFANLPDTDRWGLAFYVGGMAYSPADRNQGESLWREQIALHQVIPNLAALSRSNEAELATLIGAAPSRAVTAYLRSEPDVLVGKPTPSSLATARRLLADSVTAYSRGDVQQGKVLALSAYLDGIEPYEPMLASRDRELMRQIESEMAGYRSRIERHAPRDAVASQAAKVGDLLDLAESALSQTQSNATAAFVGSFTILLREGLEAMLIVIGMIAFLRKAERQDGLSYVHAGWVGALVAGGITWFVATYLVGISGANREVTEGLSALFAAAVLLSVGIWMHQKSLAGRWQQYLRVRMAAALSRRSAFFLFLLAFVAVYREVFETILFLIAMWSEQNSAAVLTGLVAGSATLAAVALWTLRISTRLPIGRFFLISSVLIAVLAVVLVGKGITALQEAGWMAQALIAGPRIEWLGVYPSWQSLLAQLAVALTAIVGFAVNTHSGVTSTRVTTR